MSEAAELVRSDAAGTEHFDVLIVGAGISGVGGAYHLTQQCPGTSFVVLEALASFGGTWLTHRYPGIRSDSDLYTFGYRFKPWTGAPIATAEEILQLHGRGDRGERPRPPHPLPPPHLLGAAGRAKIADGPWRRPAPTPARRCVSRANFLWMCQGYYRHQEGYTPEWDGMDSFQGRIVHPQTWPDDLDYAGKNVVVIGSGATAATLIPAIAADCAPRHHAAALADLLPHRPQRHRDRRRTARSSRSTRPGSTRSSARRSCTSRSVFTSRSFSEPEAVKQELLSAVRAHLGPDYDIDTHFTPSYRPWRQRIAFIPDGDLFQGVRAGNASVVTDEIDRFDATGILLKSGKHLDADIIVTATGFHLSVLGDIEFSIDGKPLDFADTVTYRGMMFTGVPNFAWVFGYFRASWTLRADLVADFVCRLLAHMKAKGATKVTPTLRPEDRDMPLLPWIDPENFNPGYLMRGMHLLPKRGDKPEWQHTQDYWNEKNEFPAINLNDSTFVYE